MPEQPEQPHRRWTLDEIRALRARQQALEPMLPAALAGPSPGRESRAEIQEVRRRQRGLVGPTEGPTEVAETVTGLTGVAARASKEVAQEFVGELEREFRESPLRFPAVIGGALIGRGIGGRLTRFASGHLLRAGAPLWKAGMEIFGRVWGAAGGALAGSELTRPGEETSPEAIRRRLWDGALGGVGEIITPAAAAGVKGYQKLMGKIRRRRGKPAVIPEAEEVQELLVRYGATATPGQLRTDWPTQTVETILESSLTGGSRYAETKAIGVEAALQAWRDALPILGRDLSERELGVLVDSALLASRDAQVAATRVAYRRAADIATQAGVTDNVVFIDDVITNFLNHPGIQMRLDTDPMAGAIRNVFKRFLDSESVPIVRVAKGTNFMPITFEQAEVMRSELLAISRSAENELIKGTASLALPVAEWMDEAIEIATQRLNVPHVRQAYLEARAIAKMGQEVFNDPVIGELIGKHRPEQIAQALMQSGTPSRVTAVYDLIRKPEYREAIVDPEGLIQSIQNGYLSRLFLEAGGDKFAEPSGKLMLRRMTRSRGTFEAFFPDPVQRKAFETAAHALKVTQSRAAGRAGAVFFQLKSAGAASDVLASVAYMGFYGVGAEAVGILAFPAIASIPLTSQRVTNFMLRRALDAQARKGAVSAPLLGQWMARLIEILRDEGIPFTHIAPDGTQTPFDPKTSPATSSAKPASKF